MKRLVLSLAALGVSACATPEPTAYGPASPGGPGYHELQIEQDRYRVTFAANADVSRRQAEDMALKRAAELTLDQGFEWFRVVDRHTEQTGGRDGGDGRPHGEVDVSGGSGRFGTHTGVGLGLTFDLSPDTRRFEAALEILLGHGQKPEAPDAYDARSVLNAAER